MSKRPSTAARVRPMSEVEARPVEWLWPGWIPLGKVTVLDGDPGLGKSTLLFDLAARVSRDGVMPDGAVGPVGASLILSAEDGEADTIKPRLAAAGGDMTRLFTLSAVRGDDGEERTPEIPRDLPVIEAAVAERGARLLVIDPLMAYLTGVDASRDQDVRRALFQLARLAERRGCAVVCLRHLNKTNGDKAIYRGGGSIGIIGAARAGLLVAADPDDPQRRLLAVTKCNLALPSRPLRFALAPRDGVCRVEWLGEADFEADELVRRMSSAERAEREEVRGMLVEAMGFLRDLLATGPKPRSMCYLTGEAAGYSRRTLERAVRTLGLTTAFGDRHAAGEATYGLPTPGGAELGGLAG
ncbi:MAG TPA: hypothetical protein DDY78_26255 [Planctomycetales bacterium]|nr:hypothetical protein [Planctomycetales bacterium]